MKDILLKLITKGKYKNYNDVVILSDVNCVKSVQIRSFFWSVFSCIWTEYGPKKSPYLETFRAAVNQVRLGNKLHST